MGNRTSKCLLELDPGGSAQPVSRLVNLVVYQAVCDGAKRIEFSLTDNAQKPEFRIFYEGDSGRYDVPSPPTLLFEPVVNVLCSIASVPYYAKGTVMGLFQTKCAGYPNYWWRLESNNLKKTVLLTKENQIAESCRGVRFEEHS
jgi:hypothetical protein